MSNPGLLLPAPSTPGAKHTRSSSVCSRNSCDSTCSSYTGTTTGVTETRPTILRARESRFSFGGPCDGTVFYIYDKPLPPLPPEAFVQKQKPLPPLPLDISRRRSHLKISGALLEPKGDAIYDDEKEVYVHKPYSDEKVMVENWEDQEKGL
ncbi:hypothetical protein DSL72_001471 [Monilinia vaccinii-corymbosi]|uniref:Uncharacterized protein n=1 Tax=Monilinia vaccinii-corymbosi TaxID=61207 RepID=A0A8A3P3Y6_9HELO|nr:hypothetical protein DSL72_001471 [Monilinia vaccinii-corymbosi]